MLVIRFGFCTVVTACSHGFVCNQWYGEGDVYLTFMAGVTFSNTVKSLGLRSLCPTLDEIACFLDIKFTWNVTVNR